MKTTTAPRLRCREEWENGFYRDYKGHSITLERDGRHSCWAFLVLAPSGPALADGYTREPMTKREAILYALKGAKLIQPQPIKTMSTPTPATTPTAIAPAAAIPSN